VEMLKCAQCGRQFSLSEEKASRYPGWKPRLCRDCFTRAKAKPELNLTKEEVLETFDAGPNNGIFTDGSCDPNPGPGGWGIVKVVDGAIVAERCGHALATTSNRMELTAIIEALGMLAAGEEVTVFTDSKYCFNVATTWASSWKRNGWTRGKKHEPVENLDLIKELHEVMQARPQARVEWIRGHDGGRWNEYADSLSTAYTRDRV
jgi:ribonuclease HI